MTQFAAKMCRKRCYFWWRKSCIEVTEAIWVKLGDVIRGSEEGTPGGREQGQKEQS